MLTLLGKKGYEIEMREIEIKKGKINTDLLLKYGFQKNGSEYFYSCIIFDGQMVLNFSVRNDILYGEILDEFEEEYTLHLSESASGEFVGRVKFEYENKINEVLNCVLEYRSYKTIQATEIMEYIKTTYGSEFEYLWDDDSCIARRKDNNKWYIVFMTVSKSKLGFNSSEKVEVINLRLTEENVKRHVDNQSFFSAYHMNKKYWITVLLNSGVDTNEIFKLIDGSYNLVGNKKH